MLPLAGSHCTSTRPSPGTARIAAGATDQQSARSPLRFVGSAQSTPETLAHAASVAFAWNPSRRSGKRMR